MNLKMKSKDKMSSSKSLFWIALMLMVTMSFQGYSVVAAADHLPLCCPKGQVWDFFQCVTPLDGIWKPSLKGADNPTYQLSGFPRCSKSKAPVELHQDEVFFSDGNSVNLPYYIQLHPVNSEQYCITRIEDKKNEHCEETRTLLYVCLGKNLANFEWFAVSIAHLLIILTLLCYFCIQELRCLQGQYMICWLIAVLLYNICLFPLSSIPLDISNVSCIALGAIKYFFFCGIMLWFNVICFDVWRTMKSREDISGRRRFLLYSLYTWVVGAVLTTVVLIHPYITANDPSDLKYKINSLMKEYVDSCNLRMEMDVILVLVLLCTMVKNLVFLSLATSHTCSYNKFGHGLPRRDAVISLKQAWKLYVIMFSFMMMEIPGKIFSDTEIVKKWQFILLECAAIFAVFAYRRSNIKIIFKACCTRTCIKSPNLTTDHEKGQLTS